MTPEEYLASKCVNFPVPRGVVELVPMKDALIAVRMAKGELVSIFEPMSSVYRIHVKDLSLMTEQEAIEYIDSLGCFGYDTAALRNEYKRTKTITL